MTDKLITFDLTRHVDITVTMLVSEEDFAKITDTHPPRMYEALWDMGYEGDEDVHDITDTFVTEVLVQDVLHKFRV